MVLFEIIQTCHCISFINKILIQKIEQKLFLNIYFAYTINIFNNGNYIILKP